MSRENENSRDHFLALPAFLQVILKYDDPFKHTHSNDTRNGDEEVIDMADDWQHYCHPY